MQKSYIVAMQHDYLVCHLKKIYNSTCQNDLFTCTTHEKFPYYVLLFVKFLFF